MTLEGMLANGEDLLRLRRLEQAGHFKPGFADASVKCSLAYVARIAALREVFLIIPYVGPTTGNDISGRQ